MSPAEQQAYNKQRNISPDKVKQFLAQLEATPAASRRDFVNQHPEEMRSLGQTQDPSIQAKFQEIVRSSK